MVVCLRKWRRCLAAVTGVGVALFGVAAQAASPNEMDTSRETQALLEQLFPMMRHSRIQHWTGRIAGELASSPASVERQVALVRAIPEAHGRGPWPLLLQVQSCAMTRFDWAQESGSVPDVGFTDGIDVIMDRAAEALRMRLGNAARVSPLTNLEVLSVSSQLRGLCDLVAASVQERGSAYPDLAPLVHDAVTGFYDLLNGQVLDQSDYLGPFGRPLTEEEVASLRDEIRALAREIPDGMLRERSPAVIGSTPTSRFVSLGLLVPNVAEEESGFPGMVAFLCHRLREVTYSPRYEEARLAESDRAIHAWARSALRRMEEDQSTPR